MRDILLLILVSGVFVFYSSSEVRANTINEIDSIWIIRYKGIILPPIPPPRPNEVVSEQERIELERITLVNSFNKDIFNSKGEFNPTIDWSSKVVMDNKYHQILIDILNSKDIIQAPSECFEPRHSIIFFEADKIVKYYNVCFECSTAKLNGENYIDTIDYKKLGQFMIEKGVPVNFE